MKTMTPYFSDFSVFAAEPLSAEQLKIIGIKYPAVETKLQSKLVEKKITTDRYSEYYLARNIAPVVMESGSASREIPGGIDGFVLIPKERFEMTFLGGEMTRLNTMVLGFDGKQSFDIAQITDENISSIAEQMGNRPIVFEGDEQRILSWVGYDGSLTTFGTGDFAVQGRDGQSLFVTQEWFNAKVSVTERPEVTVYTKNQCPQCDFTKRQLDRSGVRYNVINVDEQPGELEELIADGWKSVPVVKTINPISKSQANWAGNQPQQVQDFVEDLATAQRRNHERRFLAKPEPHQQPIETVVPVQRYEISTADIYQ